MEIDFREAIELMKAGKEEGFNKLYSATYNKVYFRAKQCTKTETDAQDVTQITFIEAYKNINKLEVPEATLSWLYTIVYNQSCKMYRNEREKREFLLSEETEGVFDIVESSDIETMPELSADQKATAEIIRGIIEELPELQKMTVLAFYFDNLKLEQIAETMDCSVNTVKSRLNYARKYIKDRVEGEEKKGGYKLHAFALPTLLWAIKLMSEKTTLTAYAAENIYAGSCSALGLKASTLALAGAGTSAASSAASTGASASATAAKTAAATGGKIGTAKALIIAGTVAIGGAGTIGGVYMYQHSQPAITEEIQLEDGVGVTEDGLFEYDAKGDVVTLTAYVGDETEVVIPLEVAGREQIILGSKLFQKTNVRFVDITENVIELHSGPFEEVFREAHELESVKIAGSVKEIPADTFHECTKLTRVTIEDGVQEIGDNAFFYCVALENVEIPDSVKRIGQNVFASSHVYEITVPSDCEVAELNTTGFPQQVDLIIHRKGNTADDNTVDLADIDLSEFITLSNNSGTGVVKHPEKISEYEYIFRASDFDDLTDEYVNIGIDEAKLPNGVWCESVTSGDYTDEVTPPWAGMSFSRAEGGKWDYVLKFTNREYAPKDLPYSSENGIDFQRLIGEWSAPDGTKLWIATTDGFTEGATIEFIKEHDIGWSDAELVRNEGNVAVFEYHGGGTIEIDAFDSENMHISYNLQNELGSWSDAVDYIMTNPGYEYYVH